MVHEQVDNQIVVLSIRGIKMTERILAKAMLLVIKQIKKQKLLKACQSKQSIKKLGSQGQSLSSIEITNNNIKSFERVARKYGIAFALKKDRECTPPKWFVFFKAKDVDILTLAFKEFSAKTLKKSVAKPSILEMLGKKKEAIKAISKDTIKNKTHGGLDL